MKRNKLVENFVFLFVFIAVVIYPYIALVAGVKTDLSGVEEKIDFSKESVDDYITQNFPGKSVLVKTKNQIIYSLFNSSPHIAISKAKDTLIANETLNYYYHGLHYMSEEEVDTLISKFKRFNDIIQKKGKKMLLVLTPTKARYYNGPLPFADAIINVYQNEKYTLPYDIFINKIKDTDIKCFDCINYIDTHKKETMEDTVPLFYKSGHHWSLYQANQIALKLHDYMRKEFNILLPRLSITATPSDAPIYPDNDLHELLNVFEKPNEKFYSPIIDYVDLNYQELNYTLSGGSFMIGMLFPNVTVGFRNQVYHIENKTFFYNNYKNNADFDTYEELNTKYKLLNHVKNTDIFVFEIQELNYYNASFGFLDYLLEHEEEI